MKRFMAFALLLALSAFAAQAQHEHDVIDDAYDEHRKTQPYQRFAEMTRRFAAPQNLRFVRPLENLENCEAEADQRERCADHRHQRSVGAQPRALE